VGLLDPTPPPFDPLDWVTKPFAERGAMMCRAWALQGYGTPLAAYAVYALKIAFYIGAWVAFCSLSPSLGGPSEIASWWLDPIAFQKAILWSLLFEILGLGCGSGPLTGRYFPPVGGFLYFLRPGTTKLPLFPGMPLLGGRTRGPLDVVAYATLIGIVLVALCSATVPYWAIASVAVLVPLLGVTDRTLFLAARGEHYWTTVVCMLFSSWIAGAQAVQLALWFWAGVSKLNHHFPTVVCVMNSNGPLTRFESLRKRFYRSYPDDLRPSRLATWLAHIGTAHEMTVPLLFIAAGFGWLGPHGLTIAVVVMLALHVYITSNVPMGVPLEWNFMVVYGAFALFWAHPEVTFLQVDLGLAPLLVVMLLVLPAVGNLWPHQLSFLLAMRYYAGNWAYGVWLFEGESYRKLERLTTSAPWIYDQLAHFYDRGTSVGLVGKVLAFRMMHLHGRILARVIPKAVDRFEDYEYLDGELVAGMALGWNFGDGHLHNEHLLDAVQKQCGFEPGELRCVFVESQPLGKSTMQWRIVDAADGELERGEVDVAELRRVQPWEAAQAASSSPSGNI